MKSEYYTLKGYKLRSDNIITEAMEDYLEMIYRYSKKNKNIKTNELANSLNVKPSSVSKMLKKLKDLNLIYLDKNKNIHLTKSGKKIGNYLLYRHNILKRFFKYLNKKEYNLAQVEKIEHFIDYTSINNIKILLNKLDTN